MIRYHPYRYSPIKSIIAFTIMFLIGLFLIGMGIFAINKKYDAPVYISKKFSVVGSYYYTISGEIHNRTSSDIYISSLTVACSAEKKR